MAHSVSRLSVCLGYLDLPQVSTSLCHTFNKYKSLSHTSTRFSTSQKSVSQTATSLCHTFPLQLGLSTLQLISQHPHNQTKISFSLDQVSLRVQNILSHHLNILPKAKTFGLKGISFQSLGGCDVSEISQDV